MSRRGYGYGYGGGGLEAAAGGIVALAIVLAVIVFVLTVRAIVYIVITFIKYRKETRALWYSLWVFLGCCVLSCVLAVIFHNSDNAALSSFPVYIGFFQLLLVCKVVRTQFSQTVMRDKYNLVQDILRKDFWASYEDRPLSKQAA